MGASWSSWRRSGAGLFSWWPLDRGRSSLLRTPVGCDALQDAEAGPHLGCRHGTARWEVCHRSFKRNGNSYGLRERVSKPEIFYSSISSDSNKLVAVLLERLQASDPVRICLPRRHHSGPNLGTDGVQRPQEYTQ